ncbi:MAG: hypothetical protein LBR07_01760 [Puniceicoccales bacterium]|jgi:lipopolysaccharide export system protein LptA|nr:hypothetical protein [Puniceicoccales bacterium]
MTRAAHAPRAAAALALALALAVVAGVTGAATAAKESPGTIGVIEGAMFAGFDKRGGDLVSELHARRATPENDAARKLEKSALWRLDGVEMFLFERGSKSKTPVRTVTVTTPWCRYDVAARSAASPERVKLDMPAEFRVEAAGWRWEERKDDNAVTLENDVKATFYPTARNPRVDISSKRLEVIWQKQPTAARPHLFVFTGGVRALIARPLPAAKKTGASKTATTAAPAADTTGDGEVYFFGDTLIVRARGVSDITGTAAAGTTDTAQAAGTTGGLARGRGVLDSLDAEGNVQILAQGYSVTGARTTYTRATETFRTAGDARAEDARSGLVVSGGIIVCHSASPSRKIEVFRAPANTTGGGDSSAPADPTAGDVVLEMPSFAGDENVGPGKNTRPRAEVRGDYLLVEAASRTATIAQVRGNARTRDDAADFRMTSDYVTVEAALDARAADSARLASALRAQLATAGAQERLLALRAIGNVRATHAGGTLTCERADINPRTQVIALTGNPVLVRDGARLSGARITLNAAGERGGEKISALVESSPANAATRQRAEVLLPPLVRPAPPRTAAEARARAATGTTGTDPEFADPRTAPTRVTCGRIRMREDRARRHAEFDFEDKVFFSGGVRGHCDKLTVLADTGDAPPAPPVPSANTTAGAPPKPSAGAAAARRILRMTATGSVRLAADTYAAEGGELVLHPRVALTETAAGPNDGALDGDEPQWLVLRPHESTPGKRPRITVYAEEDILAGGANAPGIGAITTTGGGTGGGKASAKKPAAAKRDARPRRVPIHIDSDLLEIVRGDRRSRFFLRDNVIVTSTDLEINGRCDNVEGVIITAPPVPPPPNPAGRAGTTGGTSSSAATGAAGNTRASAPVAVSRIVGRGNVRLSVQGSEAVGQEFEIEPLAHRFRLSGDPRVVSRDGNRVTPGGSIIYNWVKRDWELHGMRAGTGGAITRPRVTIPLGNFSLSPAPSPAPVPAPSRRQ